MHALAKLCCEVYCAGGVDRNEDVKGAATSYAIDTDTDIDTDIHVQCTCMQSNRIGCISASLYHFIREAIHHLSSASNSRNWVAVSAWIVLVAHISI